MTKSSPSKSLVQSAAVGERPACASVLANTALQQTSAFTQFQRTLGNQALMRLLRAGTIQAKLRVSQPGDADEIEADRAAEQVVAATHGSPKIQRKCACFGSGSPCAKCADEETDTIHRSVNSPLLSSSTLALQRAPANDGPTSSSEQNGNPPKSSPTPSRTHPLVVEDDAKSLLPGQMRKSAFIALLRTDACATADAVLMSVGRTTKSCPYIEKWLAFYEKQSSDHIERAIVKYAPEAAAAQSAHEAIRMAVMRVQRTAMAWARTGKVTGLPDDLASQLPGQGFLGTLHNLASSTVGGALFGFIGGVKPDKSHGDRPAHDSPVATISRKANNADPAPAHDAAGVRSRLGAGQSLDAGLQSKMSSAFGRDFSSVRIHTDSRAASLSSDLNARAFTMGSDIAFGAGEYKPGTPVGDVLIAHELAHVVQQSGATNSSVAMAKSAEGSDSTDPAAAHLEGDADTSAVRATASIWAGTKNGLARLRQSAMPRLRSGVRLQRCARQAGPTALTIPPMPASAVKGSCSGSAIHIAVHKEGDLSATFTTHPLESAEVGSAVVISVPGSATRVTQHEEGEAILKWSSSDGKGGTDSGTFVHDWDASGTKLQADGGHKIAVDAHAYGLSGRPGSEAREAAEKRGFDFNTSDWEVVEDLVFTTTAYDGENVLHHCTYGFRFHAVQRSEGRGLRGTRSRTATVKYWGIDSETVRGS